MTSLWEALSEKTGVGGTKGVPRNRQRVESHQCNPSSGGSAVIGRGGGAGWRRVVFWKTWIKEDHCVFHGRGGPPLQRIDFCLLKKKEGSLVPGGGKASMNRKFSRGKVRKGSGIWYGTGSKEELGKKKNPKEEEK